MAKDEPLFPDPHFDYKHGVLKNLPGFTDHKKLDNFERIQATQAILNLRGNPVKGCFDATHLKAIHARIFQNIYPWAGEFRQVNLRRSSSYYFAIVQFMETNLSSTLAKLAAENHLKGLDAAAFASRAA
jgi:cell filamentation protein